jgi:valyl-tRNA synthetase
MNEKLRKPYNPQETEERIYKAWEESGLFNPETAIEKGFTEADAKPFTIVLPPPNVTGILHMGHAMMVALQDLMIRYHRMKGDRTLWIPGTDHAAIATQAKVEKEIQKKEGKNRHDLGREELVKRIEQFAKESHDTIVTQIRKTGASVDWSREAFTLDEKRSLAVRTAFKNMHDAGLIYRGFRLVNWDPKGQTTVSDDEVEHEPGKAKMYTFKYSKDFPISIASVRPETKVGDVAVAVHPTDERYKQYIGKEYDLEFAGVPIHIKIIADEAVDKDFGTGAVGVTPAHSFVDWEMSERHNLPMKQVINEYAKMMVDVPHLKDKKTIEAREIIAEWLRTEGLMEKEEEIEQNLSVAERTGGVIEPLPKLQWFIDVNKSFKLPHSNIQGISAGTETTLKEIMRKTVESGQIKIIPDHFDKTYFHWVDNLRDWCISRQIWYGHRIPVWYRQNQEEVPNPENLSHEEKRKLIKQRISIHSVSDNVGLADIETYVGIEAPKGEGWEQDPDTLDTWFSSGLWTFSTLGWPHAAKASRGTPSDLEIYHPTDVLETGYEILFFWVARMILMTGYHLGEIPFKTVYLHGTIRDAQGRKMSKSLGNGIDPIDIANKYGADAGRMALILSGGPGTDSRLHEDKIKGYKHFANKIWNASRYVVENTEGISLSEKPKLSETHEKMIADVEVLVQDVTKDIEEFRFYMAGEKVYQYFWYTFADVIIENSKNILKEGSAEEKLSMQWTLRYILETMLRVIHPFMPFVTEEIWGLIPDHNKFLMVESWPASAKAPTGEAA